MAEGERGCLWDGVKKAAAEELGGNGVLRARAGKKGKGPPRLLL